MEQGVPYIIRFTAKADRELDVPVSTHVQGEDSHPTGLETSVHLTPEWKSYELEVTLSKLGNLKTSIPEFQLAGKAGAYWIKDISHTLRAGVRSALEEHDVGEALAKEGHWQEAATHLEKAVQSLTNPPHTWWQSLAVCYLMTGNEEAYQRLSRQIVTEWENRPTAWVPHIGPHALTDYSRILTLLEVTSDKPDASAADRNFYGAFLYRTGKFADAVRILAPVVSEPTNPHTDAAIYYAMALQQLGRKAEARRALEAAEKLMKAPRIPDWWHARQFELQHREALRLLRAGTSP